MEIHRSIDWPLAKRPSFSLARREGPQAKQTGLAVTAHLSPMARNELPGLFLSHPVVEAGSQVGHVPQAAAKGTDLV